MYMDVYFKIILDRKKRRTILIDEELKKIYIFHIKLYPSYVVINKNELELCIIPLKNLYYPVLKRQ